MFEFSFTRHCKVGGSSVGTQALCVSLSAWQQARTARGREPQNTHTHTHTHAHTPVPSSGLPKACWHHKSHGRHLEGQKHKDRVAQSSETNIPLAPFSVALPRSPLTAPAADSLQREGGCSYYITLCPPPSRSCLYSFPRSSFLPSVLPCWLAFLVFCSFLS